MTAPCGEPAAGNFSEHADIGTAGHKPGPFVKRLRLRCFYTFVRSNSWLTRLDKRAIMNPESPIVVFGIAGRDGWRDERGDG